jgi:MHS family proline/betaine transporter-like MFS transporter
METQNKNIFVELFKNHFKNIMLGLGIMIFPACIVVLMVSLPSYFQGSLGFRPSDVYLIFTLGYIWTAILTPLFGRFSDYIGRKNQLAIATVLFICSAGYLFRLLDHKTFLAGLIFMLAMQTIISAMAGAHFVMLTENFPTRCRCTGVAFCYNFAYIIGATMPVLFNYTLNITHNLITMVLLLIALSMLTLFSAVWMMIKIRNQRGRSAAPF